MKLYPEDVDLAELARSLEQELDHRAPAGYLEGRTELRDIVADRLESSTLEAEEIIDTMISRGFLRFTGNPMDSSPAGIWRVDTAAS